MQDIAKSLALCISLADPDSRKDLDQICALFEELRKKAEENRYSSDNPLYGDRHPLLSWHQIEQEMRVIRGKE